MANEQRLIDANALMEHLKEEHDYLMCDPEVSSKIKWWEAVCFDRVRRTIEKAPTVDAVEVVHAYWIDGYSVHNEKVTYTIDCSHCEGVFNIESHDAEHWKGKFKWCPFCGARMDGDGNG